MHLYTRCLLPLWLLVGLVVGGAAQVQPAQSPQHIEIRGDGGGQHFDGIGIVEGGNGRCVNL